MVYFVFDGSTYCAYQFILAVVKIHPYTFLIPVNIHALFKQCPFTGDSAVIKAVRAEGHEVNSDRNQAVAIGNQKLER